MIMTHGLNSHVPVVTKVKTVREGRLASARNATPDLVKKSGMGVRIIRNVLDSGL